MMNFSRAARGGGNAEGGRVGRPLGCCAGPINSEFGIRNADCGMAVWRRGSFILKQGRDALAPQPGCGPIFPRFRWSRPVPLATDRTSCQSFRIEGIPSSGGLESGDAILFRIGELTRVYPVGITSWEARVGCGGRGRNLPLNAPNLRANPERVASGLGCVGPPISRRPQLPQPPTGLFGHGGRGSHGRRSPVYPCRANHGLR